MTESFCNRQGNWLSNSSPMNKHVLFQKSSVLLSSCYFVRHFSMCFTHVIISSHKTQFYKRGYQSFYKRQLAGFHTSIMWWNKDQNSGMLIKPFYVDIAIKNSVWSTKTIFIKHLLYVILIQNKEKNFMDKSLIYVSHRHPQIPKFLNISPKKSNTLGHISNFCK